MRLSPHQLGFVFDIDGVLLRGSNVLPQAIRSLNRLESLKVPFVLLTNGGGVTEAKKAEELSQRLRVDLKPSQIILSHSPMSQLVDKYRDKVVLIRTYICWMWNILLTHVIVSGKGFLQRSCSILRL
jgi:ribonucleotide monophosphatase NagD (HAD superfamily)